jgi:hypothetical protein
LRQFLSTRKNPEFSWKTITARVGILKQNAKSRYSGIPGFEVRSNSKIFYFAELFFEHCFIAAL